MDPRIFNSASSLNWFKNTEVLSEWPRLNGFYSRDNLPNKIKDESYLTNLDEYFDTGTQWISLYTLNNNNTYFYSYRVEHILKQIIKFIERFTIVKNIFRIQAYDSVMCGYFCIEFIDFMLKGKSLTDYTNLLSPNNFKNKLCYNFKLL